MFPPASFGSATSVPTEFCAISGVSHVHVGSEARASFVSQMPPPEVPTQRRQLPRTQVGATTSAVSRLAVATVAPENANTPGWMEC